MMTLIREGGWPMWFVLFFGGLSLVTAGQLAAFADRRRLGVVIALSASTLFSICTGIVADLSAVGHHLAEHWEKYYDPQGAGYHGAIFCQGFAESMSPGIVGFTLLALTWMVVAVGMRRAARLAAPAVD